MIRMKVINRMKVELISGVPSQLLSQAISVFTLRHDFILESIYFE